MVIFDSAPISGMTSVARNRQIGVFSDLFGLGVLGRGAG
jgi:hypothetical protein